MARTMTCEETVAMTTNLRAPRNRQRFRLLVGIIALVGLLLPAIPAKAIWGSTPVPSGKYPYVGAAWLRTNCCLDIHPKDDKDESYNFVMPNPPLYPFFNVDL